MIKDTVILSALCLCLSLLMLAHEGDAAVVMYVEEEANSSSLYRVTFRNDVFERFHECLCEGLAENCTAFYSSTFDQSATAFNFRKIGQSPAGTSSSRKYYRCLNSVPTQNVNCQQLSNPLDIKKDERFQSYKLSNDSCPTTCVALVWSSNTNENITFTDDAFDVDICDSDCSCFEPTTTIPTTTPTILTTTTSITSPSAETNDDDDDKEKMYIIIGAVGGALVVIIIIVILIIVCCRRRKQEKRERASATDSKPDFMSSNNYTTTTTNTNNRGITQPNAPGNRNKAKRKLPNPLARPRPQPAARPEVPLEHETNWNSQRDAGASHPYSLPDPNQMRMSDRPYAHFTRNPHGSYVQLLGERDIGNVSDPPKPHSAMVDTGTYITPVANVYPQTRDGIYENNKSNTLYPGNNQYGYGGSVGGESASSYVDLK